jgi:hypothetical protein
LIFSAFFPNAAIFFNIVVRGRKANASGKPHRTHRRMSRAGARGDSTTTIFYSAMQLAQLNANGAGFFIIVN